MPTQEEREQRYAQYRSHHKDAGWLERQKEVANGATTDQRRQAQEANAARPFRLPCLFPPIRLLSEPSKKSPNEMRPRLATRVILLRPRVIKRGLTALADEESPFAVPGRSRTDRRPLQSPYDAKLAPARTYATRARVLCQPA
ncbi:hypothetical protein GCM10016234_08990 [Tianweitania populi]|uniref:Uncharacterized protein n=1 Tax=Tianweitania populi TaxID=1607949 RepID=A0A8J3GIR4_9HYPH|nr:hypothetical protein GCM10016234_08990 [Tianweitania populi]